MSHSQPRTEAQDSPRPHSTVPTETPRREAVEDAQRPSHSRNDLHVGWTNTGYNNTILESPSGGVDRVSPGLETTKQMLDRLTQEAEELGEYDMDCPGCGEPMSYHDDEGFVL